jgi:hypothetical protein
MRIAMEFDRRPPVVGIPSLTKIELSAAVAGILEGYTQRRRTAQALALRARIVLGCAPVF